MPSPELERLVATGQLEIETHWLESSLHLLNGVWVTDLLSEGVWQDDYPDDDLAMVLMDEPLFASGFEAGVTCAWTGGHGGACP